MSYDGWSIFQTHTPRLTLRHLYLRYRSGCERGRLSLFCACWKSRREQATVSKFFNSNRWSMRVLFPFHESSALLHSLIYAKISDTSIGPWLVNILQHPHSQRYSCLILHLTSCPCPNAVSPFCERISAHSFDCIQKSGRKNGSNSVWPISDWHALELF